MVVINVENYINAKVHTITIKTINLFWVKMNNVQNGLGIKNISHLVRKEIQDIFEKTTKNTSENINDQKLN